MNEPIRIKVPVIIELEINLRPVMAVNKTLEETKPEEKFFKEVLKIKKTLETKKGRPKKLIQGKSKVETACELAMSDGISFTSAYKTLFGYLPGGGDIKRAREEFGYIKQKRTSLKTKICRCGKRFKQKPSYLRHLNTCDGLKTPKRFRNADSNPEHAEKLKKDNEYMIKSHGKNEEHKCFLCKENTVLEKDDLCEECSP